MHKKKSRNNFSCYGFEAAKIIDMTGVQIIGFEGLEHCSQDIRMEIDHGFMNKDNLIRDKVGIDLRFYYLLEQHNINPSSQLHEVRFVERGVGYLTKKGKQLRFIRETPLLLGDNASSELHYRPGQKVAPLFHDSITIIYSIAPPTYQEALASAHCIISSTSPFNPTPVELEENSLLGRKDDCVQSIDKDELREILTDENIVDAISKQKNQIPLSSRRVNMTRKDSVLSAPMIRPYPPYKDDNRPKAQKGAIIYNETTECLEYFTGKEWRACVWQRIS